MRSVSEILGLISELSFKFPYKLIYFMRAGATCKNSIIWLSYTLQYAQLFFSLIYTVKNKKPRWHFKKIVKRKFVL